MSSGWYTESRTIYHAQDLYPLVEILEHNAKCVERIERRRRGGGCPLGPMSRSCSRQHRERKLDGERASIIRGEDDGAEATRQILFCLSTPRLR